MSTSRRPLLSRLRDLPLFAKVLAPFLVLLLVVGAAGTFLIVRDLSARARSSLNEELLRRSLDARSRIHDRELYLLESANFAANLRGIAPAVKARDSGAATALLRSVLALKTDLGLLAVTDASGKSLVQFVRQAPRAKPRAASATVWLRYGFVRAALASAAGERSAGFLELGGSRLLAIAAPICSADQTCSPVGVALVGISVSELASEAAGAPSHAGEQRTTIAVYDGDGRLLAASGVAPRTRAPSPGTGPLRRSEKVGGRDAATLYARLEIQGRQAGTLAVSLPAGLVLSSARSAAVRLALVLFFAMAGVVGIGALLSRYILGQVRPLVETSRALGRGDLAARSRVVAHDELGELAGVLNQMADQLQASHETLERRVQERTEEVERLLRERTDLFTGISHELRTPIAVILAQAKLLLSSANGSRKNAEATGVILGSAEQLLDRVNDILDVARAESGRLEVRLADVSVPTLLAELHPTIEGLASANGLRVALDVPPRLPDVRADPSRLREVVFNLVDNAVKYTPSGGTITLSAAAREGSVEISVSDTGVGIPAEVGDRVFEPFYRVPEVQPLRGQASSGLGLALAKRLVDAQGGSIGFTSTPGRGTTFTVRLRPADPERASRRGRVRPTASRR